MNLQNQLEKILHDLQFVWVDSSLILGAVILLIVGLLSNKSTLHKIFFLLVLTVALYFNIYQSPHLDSLLSNSLFITKETINFSSLLIFTTSLILIYPGEKKLSSEFYFFILSLVIGAIMLMQANSLLLIYLSIELISFVSYILTNYSFNKKGYEAAIKYLLFGALISIIMLFGIGLIYYATGSIYVSDWSIDLFVQLPAKIGLLFFVFGILFKISIFPFHIWVPAVYQSAPNDVVVVMSIVPKLAGLVLLHRIVNTIPSAHWLVEVMLWLGVLTILIGTLGAIRQTNTRRMISFGSIAHSGFLLPLAITVGVANENIFWWYSVVYAIMNVAIFYLIDQAESKGIFKNKEYQLIRKEVLIGTTFTLVLLSLVGIPPFAGFTAKFFLFSALWEMYELLGQHIYLIYLSVALLASLAAFFYYIQIPYHIFISSKSKNSLLSKINFFNSTKFVGITFSIILLLLFFVPEFINDVLEFLNKINE